MIAFIAVAAVVLGWNIAWELGFRAAERVWKVAYLNEVDAQIRGKR